MDIKFNEFSSYSCCFTRVQDAFSDFNYNQNTKNKYDTTTLFCMSCLVHLNLKYIYFFIIYSLYKQMYSFKVIEVATVR